MIETTCLIENCILSLNCTDYTPCKCIRDFVVRYNVTIKHEDDEDDIVHMSVITQKPIDDNQSIIIGEMYPCFYDQRDITTVFWIKPNRKIYFILLSLSLILVFVLILVPIIYLILIIEFTHPNIKQK
ncbi:unnamed protein product [Rotaria sordida]|uniref:Uncharacterized protein n=1 Tax=Rotaria sordida TaxID=392033 RepID=A0A815TPJ7_9BILA|nr:unnamed protein product [Rotaria sordida]CAF1256940.1 unnamed protein product [Rotaria sordida]CAF1505841.1 unnamed protein product [Rotaria sordida]CAF3842345.1 unnamed protein product [Rotaria sordida]